MRSGSASDCAAPSMYWPASPLRMPFLRKAWTSARRSIGRTLQPPVAAAAGGFPAGSAAGTISASAASTVTMKALEAAPPELRAVTVTVSDSAASVGTRTTPSASIVAPAPKTA